MEFTNRYKALNAAQRQAVDTLDGPVMVVAGPGTGKTELLSVRVANILDKTDALPSNILCLTFTDSGAVAMRERLASLIGPEAYKVAIHTFHSFGTEIINQFGEYFYHGAHFRPADELSSYEILSEILSALPHDSPLASTMNSQFTHLSDLQSTISDLKKSGLTPDEVGMILDRNDAFAEWVQPRLQTAFGDRLSKKSLPAITSLCDEIDCYNDEPLALIGYQPLHHVISTSLRRALQAATDDNTTKPLSAWKKSYLARNAHDEVILRDARISRKLRAASQVYYEYLVAMQSHELFDYDDMILRVVHAMEVFAELRSDLQETYQYILVDEFQDTNDAQMRLIWNLTNNPASEGQPNLMVVGDDDQAIYRFQGATMSNILDFTSRYRDTRVVTLKDNYRSDRHILDIARSVITLGQERLETTLGLDKSLTAHHVAKRSVTIRHNYESEHESRHALAAQIAADYRADSSRSRAIIARNHRQLAALIPHLQALDVPLRYERQENVLDSEPVRQLELVTRVVHYLAEQRFDESNALLPELLAHPAWAVSAQEVWQLSLNAHRDKVFWLEAMLTHGGKLQTIAEWLIVAAHYAKTEPLEFMCDNLFGANEAQASENERDEMSSEQSLSQEEFVSPYRAYFFPSESLDTRPGQYLAWLDALQRIRASLREFRADQILQLTDMVEFLDLHREMQLAIQGRSSVEHDASAVTLLTAHKSKGLEFDEVYITDATESIWGSSARSRSRLIQFPSNIPISPAGDSDDERLRLLYVALTRARDQLSLWSARLSDGGKALLPVGSISPDSLAITEHEPLAHIDQITATENDWRGPLLDVVTATKDQLLRPLLEHYKLSATHLNHFLDVSRGGPQLFLLHNLLRFPQMMSVSAAYGSAIHTTLQRAHAHLASTGKRRPVEDVLHDYEENLRRHQLTELDFAKQLQRGSQVLTTFLAARYDSFSAHQLVERDFRTESILVGDALITGAIDLIDIDVDEKTIYITDYKTGSPVHKWQGKTDYEKIKLHHYEQQLMMYKLLVENSRQFRGYTVTGARIEFVEPDEKNDIVLLDYVYDEVKLAQFRELINAVWVRIHALDFELPGEYEVTIKGIMAFESDLLT